MTGRDRATDQADDQAGTWLRLGEAAARLGTSVEGVRSRIKRRKLRTRPGNDGRLRVLVPAPEFGQAANGHDQAPPGQAWAPTGHDQAVALARDKAAAETERWRCLVEEERLARAKAEAERDAAKAAHDAETTLLREALAREADHARQERARGDRLEAEALALARALAEARRPWLAKVLEGLRRKGG